METGRQFRSRKNNQEEHKYNKPHLIGELVTGRSAQSSTNGGQCWKVCFSDDNTKLAWSAGNGEVIVLPWEEYKTCLEQNTDFDGVLNAQVVIDAKLSVTSLAFNSSGNVSSSNSCGNASSSNSSNLLLATGHDNGRIRISDAQTGELILELSDHRRAVRALAFSPDNNLLVSAAEDGQIKVWDMCDGGNMVKTLKEHRSVVHALAWSPNGYILCSVGNQQKAVLWDMHTFSIHRRLQGHYNDVTDCCFSPDGALLATSSTDTRVLVWSTETGEELKELLHETPAPGILYMSGANSTSVTGVSFANSSHKLTTVCSDGKIRFWDLYTGTSDESLDGLENSPKDDSMLCCSHSPLGGCLAVGYASGNALIYSTEQEVPTLLQLSRISVRKACPLMMSAQDYDSLEIPETLTPCLQYKYWH